MQRNAGLRKLIFKITVILLLQKCAGGLQKLTFLNLNGNQLKTLPSEINRYRFMFYDLLFFK